MAHFDEPRRFTRGKIALEELVHRFGEVTIADAWLPNGEEGYIVWVGDPPQAGCACHGLMAAYASAVIAAGGEVVDGRGKRCHDGND